MLNTTNFEFYINEFSNFLLLERNLSTNTINSYRKDILQLENYISIKFQKNICIKNALSKEVFDEYLIYLYDKEYKPATLARKLSSVKSFLIFLEDEKIINSSPVKYLKFPKLERKIPKTLNQEIIDTMLDNSKNLSLRDSTIIELIYATGIRASELINIKITDIDFNEATLRILGKGSKERIIPIHDLALKLISKYWKNEIFNHNKKVNNKNIKFNRNLLFLNVQGEKLTRQGLWYIIKNISKKLGLDINNVSPHILRHTFATHLLYNGVPLRHLQELLGHSNISTTQIYTHLSDQYIESEYSKFSPRVI
jgi:integrase/recombinase XerD